MKTQQIINNAPQQYIQGYTEFYKLKFKITPDVLIPRPETELLVDEVLAFLGSDTKKGPTLILDIGTGSGNIAISLAENLPNARIFATDISEAALEVARENARKRRVEKRIFFIKSDLLSIILASDEGATPESDSGVVPTEVGTPQNDMVIVPNIIVSNLPYIPSARIPYLDPSVKDFEPRVALDGGPDGFELYRKLFQQIQTIQKYQGVYLAHLQGVLNRHTGSLQLLVCEIDYTQGEIAIFEAQKNFPDAKIEIKTDLAKKQRILLIKS